MFRIWMICHADASAPGYELLTESGFDEALSRVKRRWPLSDVINVLPCDRANIPDAVWDAIPECLKKHIARD